MWAFVCASFSEGGITVGDISLYRRAVLVRQKHATLFQQHVAIFHSHIA